jgi:hypothetical protein
MEQPVVMAENINYVEDDLRRVILMNTETGELWALDASAALVWENLATSQPLSAAVDALVSTYGIDTDAAVADVNAFVTQLVENGVVSLRNAE